MKVSLVVLSTGKAAGQAIPIPTAQFIIGRDPQCNLRPGSAMISKRHCAILVKNEQVFLRDFGSTNGTFLNDVQVQGEVPVKDGDVLKAGPLLFKVAIVGTPAPSTPTPPPAPPQPKKSNIMDDDAAAMLLDVDEDGAVSVPVVAGETEEASVPGGSTVTEMPAVNMEELAKQASAKPAESKPAEPKKKPPAGAAQDAAKALLEKLRQGRRK
jgi:pSer/pThr/pTyr-binding forkhead associated (FHA) protein